MSEKIDLRSLLPEELPAVLKEHGLEAYRADQILSWLEKGAGSFDEMTNLSKAHREKLSEIFTLIHMKEADRLI